jgi:flotillin
MTLGFPFLLFVFGVFLLFIGLVVFFARYKRCPANRILVVAGKVAGDRSAQCYNGGATFVWPLIQEYGYLDLTPIQIEIKLESALSMQNIRINTPSTFTVGISTEPGVMENAAERMFGLPRQEIRDLARDIIFGQMRVVIAIMSIEEINSDRDKFIENIFNVVGSELKKIGLYLINVNIQDITDESGYIDALGQEAAARAINEAKRKVAQQERDGEIGKARAEQERRTEVARANAEAVQGEDLAKVTVANSNAERREREAEAERRAAAAEKVQAAHALEEAYAAEQEAEKARGERDRAAEYANVVVPAEVEKARIETLAEAEAEKERRLKRGEADGIRMVMEAEALGVEANLRRKAIGLNDLVKASGDDPRLAALLLIAHSLPELVAEQVRAISNLKIDSITVWEGGRKENGRTSTADFLSGLVGALPPLHEITRNVGIELPDFLGRIGRAGGEGDVRPVSAEKSVEGSPAEPATSKQAGPSEKKP